MSVAMNAEAKQLFDKLRVSLFMALDDTPFQELISMKELMGLIADVLTLDMKKTTTLLKEHYINLCTRANDYDEIHEILDKQAQLLERGKKND